MKIGWVVLFCFSAFDKNVCGVPDCLKQNKPKALVSEETWKHLEKRVVGWGWGLGQGNHNLKTPQDHFGSGKRL